MLAMTTILGGHQTMLARFRLYPAGLAAGSEGLTKEDMPSLVKQSILSDPLPAAVNAGSLYFG